MEKFIPHKLSRLHLRLSGAGYVWAIYPEHPNACWGGRIFLHRLVMENKLGRYLEENEIVHHRDRNKQNNNPDNLELVTNDEHAVLHRSSPPRRKCAQCGVTFTVTARSGHKYSYAQFCSVECREAHRIHAIAKEIKSKRRVYHGKKKTHCVQCGGKIRGNGKQYCSLKCSRYAQRRAIRPLPEELKKLVWSASTESLAKQLGVTGSAIAKWCKEAGIKKPPRGYWTKNKTKYSS